MGFNACTESFKNSGTEQNQSSVGSWCRKWKYSYPSKKSGRAVIGIEPLTSGARALTFKGITAYQGVLEDLAFPDSSLEAIGVFDVLEHLEDPATLLLEIRRVLKPGGVLISTVPANAWLFSDFDLSIGHYRRYSRQSLRKLLAESGFQESRISYFFFVLVLPAFLLRTVPYKFGRRRMYRETIKSNNFLSRILKVLNPLLTLILKIEDKVSLPTGLSLISVSFRPQ